MNAYLIKLTKKTSTNLIDFYESMKEKINKDLKKIPPFKKDTNSGGVSSGFSNLN
jgi:hypothetical protein